MLPLVVSKQLQVDGIRQCVVSQVVWVPVVSAVVEGTDPGRGSGITEHTIKVDHTVIFSACADPRVDASHEDDVHEVPGMARFVPLLSTIGVFRLLGVSFGQRVESLAPSVQRYAQATRFRAAGYQATADEIMHIAETVSEVRNTRGKLTIPVLVVTGARGADANWRRLQQDEASLSERGCLITAQQSGHVIPIDQPKVVVDAIRTVVEIARGQEVPLCATLAANGRGNPPRE